MNDTPETDKATIASGGDWCPVLRETCRRLERERDEAREALREIWQSGDAFLPYVDAETINRWRKAAGWDGTK
jgi:hypothetical protein